MPAHCKLTSKVRDGCTFYDVVCDKPQQCSLSCKPGFECRVEQGFEQCLKAVKTINKCKLPLDKGPCRGNIVMWYYNARTSRCEQFSYGGCHGNENRFQTREICEQTCLDNSGAQQQCTLPCRAGYECKFIQGFQQCVESDKAPSEKCKQPKDPGPCSGYVPSWFYNASTNCCEQFIYGGCGGNNNRFDTQELCEEMCE